jgi:hypothetical protein
MIQEPLVGNKLVVFTSLPRDAPLIELLLDEIPLIRFVHLQTPEEEMEPVAANCSNRLKVQNRDGQQAGIETSSRAGSQDSPECSSDGQEASGDDPLLTMAK